MSLYHNLLEVLVILSAISQTTLNIPIILGKDVLRSFFECFALPNSYGWLVSYIAVFVSLHLNFAGAARRIWR